MLVFFCHSTATNNIFMAGLRCQYPIIQVLVQGENFARYWDAAVEFSMVYKAPVPGIAQRRNCCLE